MTTATTKASTDENENLLYITFDYEGTYLVHDTRAPYEIGKRGQ